MAALGPGSPLRCRRGNGCLRGHRKHRQREGGLPPWSRRSLNSSSSRPSGRGTLLSHSSLSLMIPAEMAGRLRVAAVLDGSDDGDLQFRSIRVLRFAHSAERWARCRATSSWPSQICAPRRTPRRHSAARDPCGAHTAGGHLDRRPLFSARSSSSHAEFVQWIGGSCHGLTTRLGLLGLCEHVHQNCYPRLGRPLQLSCHVGSTVAPIEAWRVDDVHADTHACRSRSRPTAPSPDSNT